MTHREYLRHRQAIYLDGHRDSVNARRRQRYAENRTERQAQTNAYRAANRERHRALANARYHRSNQPA